MTTNGFRLYLRLNDVVTHRDYREWGEGTVVEEMTSTVPGGTCLVRIQFQDGRQRTFQNDLDNPTCCYYFGIRKYWMADAILDAPRVRRATAPRPAALSAPRRRRARRQT
ncbi:MAG: hypothetical protein ACRERC_22575 [Candidatus Binatia bacterium]